MSYPPHVRHQTGNQQNQPDHLHDATAATLANAPHRTGVGEENAIFRLVSIMQPPVPVFEQQASLSRTKAPVRQSSVIVAGFRPAVEELLRRISARARSILSRRRGVQPVSIVLHNNK